MTPKNKQCDGEAEQVLQKIWYRKKLIEMFNYNDEDKWRRDVYMIFYVPVTYVSKLYIYHLTLTINVLPSVKYKTLLPTKHFLAWCPLH